MGKWTTSLAAALGVFAFLVAVAPADASSIFFMRDYNIWVANPNGSGAKQVTTDGTMAQPYDFVTSAKDGSAPPIGFHHGGISGAGFGTINPNGSGESLNPADSKLNNNGQGFTRLNDAGNDMTYAAHCSCSGFNYFAGSVGTNGSSGAEIYNPGVYENDGSVMSAINVAFGDPAGSSLLFTDVGENYGFQGNQICNGTDGFGSVLALQAPSASTPDNTVLNASAAYCVDNTNFYDPALSPNGQMIAAQATGSSEGDTGQIVTIPIGGGVTSDTDQSPITQITPANSGDSDPDFSPDNTELAFQGPSNTIYTVPAGGGHPTEILTNASVPAWSPYTLPSGANPGGGGTKLKLSVSASSPQNLVKQKRLVLHVKSNLSCVAAAVADVNVKGTRKPYKTNTPDNVLRANRSVTFSLTLSRKSLVAIKKALAHHKRVTAVMVVVAQGDKQTVDVAKTIRVKN